MWTAGIQRRKEALRLVRTAGAEVSADFGKSQIRQLLEIGLLGLRGYGAADYYLLGLYRDIRLANKFMTGRQYNEIRRQLNAPVQGIIEFNKWIFGKYCESVGVPTPRCHGVFHREIGFTDRQTPLRSLEDLGDLLGSIGGAIVIKPLAGDRGDSVRVFDSIDRQARTLVGANRCATTIAELHESLNTREEPWLLQEKVNQHATLSALHDSSVNTVRMITLRDDDGDIAILAAALRIGVGGAEIDNTTGGGIAAPVDLASGTCGPARSRSSIRTLSTHPDTGAQIEGVELPYWDIAKQTALRAHRFLPFARSLGWDIAFGAEGPVVLEVNGSWYYNRVQMTGQSLWDTAFGKSLVGRSYRHRRRRS